MRTTTQRIRNQTRTKYRLSRTRAKPGSSLARAACSCSLTKHSARKSTRTICCVLCELGRWSLGRFLMYSQFLSASPSLNSLQFLVAYSYAQAPDSTVRVPRNEPHAPSRGLLLRQSWPHTSPSTPPFLRALHHGRVSRTRSELWRHGAIGLCNWLQVHR